MEDKHLFIYSTHKGHLESPTLEIKVSDLKDIIAKNVEGFDAAYTLVQEERGDEPDKPLNDTDTVRIVDVPHFYSQPPADFGA